MAKKRQQDFHKVQLKPGRLLSKHRNITQTNFKAKKIIMPKEKPIKMKSELTISEYLRRIRITCNEKDKISLLNDLSKLVQRHSDNLSNDLIRIFTTFFECIRDPHDGVRNAAVKAFLSASEVVDDLQLQAYTDLISLSLSTLMTNPNQKIVSASLVLLDCLLKNHPDVICQNITILYYLLPSERKHYTRKITTERETYQYSEKEDINALGHINAFLKNMLKDKNDFSKYEKDENDVYWDPEEGPLYLEIYRSGGLQPVNIEEAFAKQCHEKMDPFHKNEKLMGFIDSLLKHIEGNFCQIIGSESSGDDNIFRSDPIADLSILIQLLCNVAELAEKISYSTAEEEIATFLKEKVFSTHRKRFPFDLHAVIPGTTLQQLALLNLSLCYLFMKFLSSNDGYEDDSELIEKYFRIFFSVEKGYSPDIKCKCMSLFKKMIQLYSYKADVPDFIYYLLKHLVSSMTKIRINHPNKKILINLLIEMSLYPEYSFWLNSEAIESWYDWLSNQLKENLSKMDKSLLKAAMKIANRKPPSFMKNLDATLIKTLLKHRNEDVKETAIFLAYNMDIDERLLKNISDVISLDSFPQKSAIKLIRLLSCRFLEKPQKEKAIVDFALFLLNIGIDAYNLYSNKMVDFEANEYTQALKVIQDGHTFNIFPSLHFKEHSKMLDVCVHIMKRLPQKAVSYVVQSFFKEVLESTTTLPVHCALSILKMNIPEIKDKYHRLLMRDLNFSCILTISVLTQMPMDEEWYRWNVMALMSAVDLSEGSALNYLELLEDDFGKPDPIVVYHILRALKVFIERNALDYNCSQSMEYALKVIRTLVENRCSDATMKLQPLYKQLYNFLQKQAYRR